MAEWSYRSDGTWSCVIDGRRTPCGGCGGCREVQAENRAAKEFTLAEQVDLDALLYGNAYIHFIREGNGLLTARRVDPRDITIRSRETTDG